jgi:hypothetical protein
MAKKKIRNRRNFIRPRLKFRDVLSILAELAGIAGFILALYIFLKGG